MLATNRLLWDRRRQRAAALGGLLALLLSSGSGCGLLATRDKMLEAYLPPDSGVPRELAKTTMPTYRVEPPDVLLVDAIKVVPKAPYHIEPADLLQIVVSGTLPDQPIVGIFTVDSSGMVALGPSYGSVSVVGLTIPEAEEAIREHLEAILTAPEVSVSLAQPAAKQQITGEHLVGPDGLVNLGVYGGVFVAGMSLSETRAAIEAHLSEFLEDPQISVDVFAYNSKTFYVIMQGGGLGDQVDRFPITGNETVLDAIALLGGMTQISSKRMWIARPAPDGLGYQQILPINYREITQGASTTTNYQLMPGDRLYIAEDKMIALDNFVAKMTSPFERLFGFTLLGSQTIQTVNRFPRGQGGLGNQGVFF